MTGPSGWSDRDTWPGTGSGLGLMGLVWDSRVQTDDSDLLAITKSKWGCSMPHGTAPWDCHMPRNSARVVPEGSGLGRQPYGSPMSRVLLFFHPLKEFLHPTSREDFKLDVVFFSDRSSTQVAQVQEVSGRFPSTWASIHWHHLAAPRQDC